VAVRHAEFLREFLRAPLSVGAVAPSSGALAATITAPIPSAGAPVVVELGPGTGAFTAVIQRRLGGRGLHLAIELNERFARRLSDGFPGVAVTAGDARDLERAMGSAGHHHADVIVSGLPWAAFDPVLQDTLLDAVVGSLAPDGAFTTFAYTFARYTPAAVRLRRSLADRFEEVVRCRTVWANLQPAFVYFCRRPRTS
jgi:phospholipid N-methyltransferase